MKRWKQLPSPFLFVGYPKPTGKPSVSHTPLLWHGLIQPSLLAITGMESSGMDPGDVVGERMVPAPVSEPHRSTVHRLLSW